MSNAIAEKSVRIFSVAAQTEVDTLLKPIGLVQFTAPSFTGGSAVAVFSATSPTIGILYESNIGFSDTSSLILISKKLGNGGIHIKNLTDKTIIMNITLL